LSFTQDVTKLVVTLTPDYVAEHCESRFRLILPIKNPSKIEKIVFYAELIWKDGQLTTLGLNNAVMYLSTYGQSTTTSSKGIFWARDAVEIQMSPRRLSKKSKRKRISSASAYSPADDEQPGVMAEKVG